VNDTNIVTRNVCKQYVKERSINDQKIETHIDTGSDIRLMRANQYIRVSAPKLQKKTIQFYGIGLSDNVM